MAGSNPRQILSGGTASTFKPRFGSGTMQVLVTEYGASTTELTLQFSLDDGTTWIDTDVTFDAVGSKRFGAVAALYRLNATTLTGATAYAAEEDWPR